MINIDIVKRKRTADAGPAASGGIAMVSTRCEYSDESGHAQSSESSQHAVMANEATHAQSARELDGNSSVWQKIRDSLSELSGTYLSKLSPDTAQGLITFLQGLTSQEVATFLKGAKFGEKYGITNIGDATLSQIVADAIGTPGFVSSLIAGMGWRIDEDGVLECNGIKVRSYMEVMELIVNRLSAIEGDQLLTEADSIESVETITNADGTDTYRLHLKSKWEGYYTAQAVGNVLKGIKNTLEAGNGTYVTSWSRVVGVDTAHNTVDVVLYPDTEVPGGKNFPPSPMMNVARWGNAIDTTRQSCIYLSSTEGRIVKLANVTKPIIDKGNYGFVIGDMPDFVKDNKAIQLRDGVDYVYVGGLIYDDLIHIPYQGKQLPTYVDRGQWSPTPDEPYHCEARNSMTGVYETSDVWYKGCKWRCLADAATEAPKWNSTQWAMIEGNPGFTIDIESTNGNTFVKDLSTTLSVRGWLYNQDITDDIVNANVVWSRYSEAPDGTPRTAADESWNTAHVPAKTLLLTNDDVGIDSSGFPKKLVFKAVVTLDDGTTDFAEFSYS
jgi:hypothetical protein